MTDKPRRKKPQGKINPRIVVEGLLAGKKKKDIAVEAGSLAKTDQSKCTTISQALKSNEYKEEALPFVEQMKKERDRVIREMRIKDLDKVEYDKLATALDRFTKNIQLLSGESTDNVTISWE